MTTVPIVLDGTSYTITVTKADQPPPPPPPPTLATRKSVIWHHGWAGQPIGQWPADVRSSINVVALAMSQSASAGTGKLTSPPGVTKADVTGLRARGIDVLVGVGGGGDGGITIRDSVTVGQAVTSIQGLASTLAVNGVVWDLEGTPGDKWTTDAVITASRGLQASGLKVAICSALWGGRGAAWGQVASALGASLLHWERMFYDFPEAGDGRLSDVVTHDLQSMRAYTTREDQVVATFMGTPPEGGYPNSSPTNVLASAYRAARAKYPQAGWSVWESRIEGLRGWPDLRALATI